MSTRQVLVRQVRLNQRSFWRNPESAVFNFAMPLGVLLIFGATVRNDPIPGHHGVKVLTLSFPESSPSLLSSSPTATSPPLSPSNARTGCSNGSEQPR